MSAGRIEYAIVPIKMSTNLSDLPIKYKKEKAVLGLALARARNDLRRRGPSQTVR